MPLPCALRNSIKLFVEKLSKQNEGSKERENLKQGLDKLLFSHSTSTLHPFASHWNPMKTFTSRLARKRASERKTLVAPAVTRSVLFHYSRANRVLSSLRQIYCNSFFSNSEVDVGGELLCVLIDAKMKTCAWLSWSFGLRSAYRLNYYNYFLLYRKLRSLFLAPLAVAWLKNIPCFSSTWCNLAS